MEYNNGILEKINLLNDTKNQLFKFRTTNWAEIND